ncbi:poly-beta-1,6-N-acetyl-D-glucosamine biosynthesis protein PgaD [Luteibacter sp. SG786]|uniref:poly-beta-1,6-N-acetyl-D-glucosamine biosynthesis protein PgaD n=1 Tax=Luteibacter sp. SG786 TaxID=2587130 RepID=UPI001423247D|nr:poly-beta-1,6-N-acetyl-D-glucosamine biosynthesis protein PgaD [Luteibacter sp. SG786]NII53675.1 biofilm PGA synthesis protein PgaD [Luteibacter sp. SG786]
MKAEAIIIQRPERQSHAQRAVFATLTVFAWLFWAFLWLPLLTLAAWAFGVRTAWVQLRVFDLVENGGDINVILIVAVACAAIFFSWSKYNHARFAGKQKRRGNKPVGVAQTAAAIGASTDDALKIQAHRRAVVSVSADGFMTVNEAV